MDNFVNFVNFSDMIGGAGTNKNFMELDEKTQYDKLIKELKKHKRDNEIAHIIQDIIYRKFILDISNNLLSKKQIYEMSKKIKEHVIEQDNNRTRWYA